MLDSLHDSRGNSDQSDSSSPFTFADVLVPRRLDYPFTYRVPAVLQRRLQIGSRVRVPFGPGTVEGVVVAYRDQPPGGREGTDSAAPRLREIGGLAGDGTETIPQDLLELTRLVSEHYVAPWGQCLRLVLPPSPSARVAHRYAITDAGRQVQSEPGKPAGQTRGSRLSATAREVLARLAKKPRGLRLLTLRGAIRGPVAATLSTLKRRGLVREVSPDGEARLVGRRRLATAAAVPDVPSESIARKPPGTTIAQGWDKLRAALDAPRQATVLIEAPAADRMESLIQGADLALARQRSVLVITPEIARAAAIAARAATHWGPRVGLWHGGLSLAARADLWRRIRTGSVNVVVGTRSAVFAPLPDVGLICIDEEEDPSLKEEQEPHYHAREVAGMRAGQHQAVLLLGSSHPSLETRRQSHVDRLVMDETTTKPAVPPVIQAVDIRHTPYGTLLSESMIAGVRAALDARTGVVLFLNRKGFAPAIQCRDCGHALQCRNCSVALTFYRRAGRLTCSYCGTSFPLPNVCPVCQAIRLEPVGFGTEHLEEEVRRRFRNTRIARLDGDTARTPAQAEAIRLEVSAGTVDILIGTQMLFQGSPLPSVGFVGLPHADAGLHRPDFRSAERTYQTLVDAISLARPGDRDGTVILQTYLPTHPAIAAVVNHNPSLFYDHELESRRTLGYPPFTRLISLCVSGKHEGLVKEAAQQWATRLAAASLRYRSTTDEITILGPIPAPVAQRRGLHRWQVLVKATHAEAARLTVRSSLDALEQGRRRGRGTFGVKFEVDVDPIELG